MAFLKKKTILMIVTGKTDHSAKNGNTNDTTHAYK